MEETLRKTITEKLQQMDKYDIEIENIRFHETDGRKYALVDISYKWALNAWEKTAKHPDSIFVLKNNDWTGPLVNFN